MWAGGSGLLVLSMHTTAPNLLIFSPGCCCLCGRGELHSPWSLLETLIVKTCKGQSSMPLVTFFLPVLAAVVLKPKQVIKGAKTIISEISVKENWEGNGLLENWYCHKADLTVPLFTIEPWLSLYQGLPLQVIINLIAAHSLIFFLALHMFTFCPQIIFFFSLHLFFCLWGTLVTMEMTTSSGWVELSAM